MRKILTTAILAAAIASPAFAWGDREQGALTGFVIGTIIGQQHQRPAYPVYTPPPVYTPAPVYLPPPVVYTYPQHVPTFRQRVDVFIPECNCYRTIEVITR